jgi:CheY-like chemotaxis protein
VVFEEELFSISKQSKYKELKTIAKNTYYENVLYSTVSSRKKPKVFIVDDNKVNIKLLESILEGVYCDVYHDIDAKNGLEKLKKALVNSNPYDVVFLDKHMPGLSGTELLREYRKFEDQYSYSKPIYSVSITGDVATDEEEKKLYDLFLKKPFKSNDIREVFNKI